MARVTIPAPETASDDLKETFGKMEANGRQVLHIYRVMSHCPKVGRDFLRLGNALLSKGSLDPKLREIAILRTGAIARSSYEWSQHVPIGRRVGLTDEQINSLDNWKGSPHFDQKEQAVLQYTDEVAQNVRVSDETFGKAKTYLNEEQLVELTTVIGYYGMVSRVLEALQVELEPNKKVIPFSG